MNAPAVIAPEPTAGDVLAELQELAASLVRLTASHVGASSRGGDSDA